MRIPRVAGAQMKGPDVVTPIEDVMALSTTSVAQGCLEAMVANPSAGVRYFGWKGFLNGGLRIRHGLEDDEVGRTLDCFG